jgi:hypothetical protein
MGFLWLLAVPSQRARPAGVPSSLCKRTRFDGKMMPNEERCGVRGAVFGHEAHFH